MLLSISQLAVFARLCQRVDIELAAKWGSRPLALAGIGIQDNQRLLILSEKKGGVILEGGTAEPCNN